MSAKLIFLIAAAVCFGLNAVLAGSRINLDAAGKCFVVLSFLVQ